MHGWAWAHSVSWAFLFYLDLLFFVLLGFFSLLSLCISTSASEHFSFYYYCFCIRVQSYGFLLATLALLVFLLPTFSSFFLLRSLGGFTSLLW